MQTLSTTQPSLPNPHGARMSCATQCSMRAQPRRVHRWLAATILLCFGCWLANDAYAAARVKFSSRYRGATVFRDINGNGAQDIAEMRPNASITTDDDGSFFPPRAKGRLYLQGGTDIDTGQPNTLLLTAPSGARGIGVLTSLFQALADRKVKTTRIRTVLNLNPRARIQDLNFMPIAQATGANKELLQRNAQQAVLARFLKGLTLGAGASPNNGLLPKVANGARSTARATNARQRGDATINMLADSLLTAPLEENFDLSEQTTVRDVLDTALGEDSGVSEAELNGVADSASTINDQFLNDQFIAEFELLLQEIIFNAFLLLSEDDLSTFLAEFTDTELEEQFGGDIFTPRQTSNPIELLSRGPFGEGSNGNSSRPRVNGNGRFVVFASTATNLVAADANGRTDVFRRDVFGTAPELVSVNRSGAAANGDSDEPVLSVDGRTVAFASDATDLVANDANGVMRDIFVRDLQTGTTRLVSAGRRGVAANGPSASPSISDDGRLIAFLTAATNLTGNSSNGSNIVLRNLANDTPELITAAVGGVAANGPSFQPAISGDGRFVVFVSNATNLTSAGNSVGFKQVYLRDLRNRTTEMVSAASDSPGNGDSDSPSISRNGRFIAYATQATNLQSGIADTNQRRDVVLIDRESGISQVVSVDPTGVLGNGDSDAPSVVFDGTDVGVAFQSTSTNLSGNDANGQVRDVYLRLPSYQLTLLVSQGGVASSESTAGPSSFPDFAADAPVVVFQSQSNGLVPNDNNNPSFDDVFLATLLGEVAGDQTTTGRLDDQGAVANAVDFAGDTDWFAVSLDAGTTYQIDLEGLATGQGTLADPLLDGVYDTTGARLVSAQDDGGVGTNSRAVFSPPRAGVFFISAAAFQSGVGTYRLSIRPLDGLSSQSITFTQLADRTSFSAVFQQLEATASSGLPITFSSLTPTVCFNFENQVFFILPGVCSIAADQPGDGSSIGPAPRVIRSFQVRPPMAAGNTHSLVLFPINLPPLAALFSTGSNGFGQLGSGDSQNRLRPGPVLIGEGSDAAAAIAVYAGGDHSLGFGSDERLSAAGANDEGQLGDGTTTNRFLPVEVALPANITVRSAAAGLKHSLVIGSDGNLYAWGSNRAGQLGDGSTATRRTSPVRVRLPVGVVPNVIAAGAEHSLAIGSDGKLYAWGFNREGELGTGTTGTNSNLPLEVVFPDGVTAREIAAAPLGDHSYAIGSDGNLYAWGLNDVGQLGDGTNINRARPTRVPFPLGVSPSFVAAGGAHGLALGSDGQLYAWGLNHRGQLGNGTTISHDAPEPVDLSGSTPLAIAAGTDFSLMFVGADGNGIPLYQGWGANELGQLGTGIAEQSVLTPTAALIFVSF